MSNLLVESIRDEVRRRFEGHSADHDFNHIDRVFRMAMYLQSREGGNADMIACAALLHDISDHKLNGGKLNDGGRVAIALLIELGADESFAREVGDIVDQVSFKGAGVPDTEHSLELQIVRDADRLDAIGAIGVARAFHYGGRHDRPFYDPEIAPENHQSFEAYAKDKSHTINHFHEKLLLLKDRLHTQTAKKIGEERHRFLEQFVAEFYKEWSGSRGE